MVKIKNRWTGEVIFETEADLRKADLRGANLREANFWKADLRGANLRKADLWRANLIGADLTEADLWSANLIGANLVGANLVGANLDFSSGLFFGCKSFGFKADLRIAAQLAYHFCQIDFDCDEAVETQEKMRGLANKFHRIGKDVGKIK